MKFDFSKYQSEDAAKLDLEKILPIGTPLDRVQELMRQSEVKCFGVSRGVLPCRYVQPSSSMVNVIWSLAFHLDSENKLTRIVMTRGLTGP